MANSPQSLTDLPRTLIEAGYDDAPSYRTVYAACVNGRLPVSRNKKGHWTFDPSDLPAIIDALGLSDNAAAA